jgi:hypothetical protein
VSLKLKVETSFTGVDVSRYTQVVRNRLRELMEVAARDFLIAVSSRIRIRTGFLHGAMGNLAQRLRTSLPPGRPGTKPRKKEYYYQRGNPRLLKTKTSGLQFATANPLTQTSQGFIFEYDVDIDYFFKNDVSGHAGRSPWNAYRAGIEAFTKTFLEGSEELFPDINDFLIGAKTNVTF